VGLARILDHGDAVAFCNVEDGIEISGAPVEVDGDDRACPGRDRVLERSRIDVPGLSFDVREARAPARMRDRLGRRDERVRRRDDLVARSNASSDEGEV